jgi:thiamine transport system ATP-binding protein
MLLIEDCRLDYSDFAARYSLNVAAGALCAVVGPSGGGKTTLLNLVAGFERQRSGTLSFGGQDLTPLRPAERPVAMVFQDHNLFPHLTAFDNAALGLRPSLRLDQAEALAVTEALAAVELDGLGDRLPEQMSGGQRQRVALARALVTRKPLLLLDEPFGGLDPGLRRTMIRLVDALRRQRAITMLLTIHTPDDITATADRVAFVADGEVIAEGAPHDVLDPRRDPRIAAFLG